MKCTRIICTFLLSLLMAGLCLAQGHREDYPIPEELYEVIKKRSEAINAELASLPKHEWAGAYLQGDHHPTVLLISPQNGFVVTASLHSFYPSWVNFGKVDPEISVAVGDERPTPSSLPFSEMGRDSI